MSDDTYNGWTNYETWNVKLWLDNDEGTQGTMLSMARDVKTWNNDKPFWTREEYERFTLADMLKDWVEEMTAPDDSASMAADLLRAALGRVDWHEIADNILADSDWED
jgi:hypothetical protein